MTRCPCCGSPPLRALAALTPREVDLLFEAVNWLSDVVWEMHGDALARLAHEDCLREAHELEHAEPGDLSDDDIPF